MLYNLWRNNYKLSLKYSSHKISCETGKQLIKLYWIFKVFWYMTLCHQVSTIQSTVMYSSTEWGTPRVPFVAMLNRMKRHFIPSKHQQLHKQQTHCCFSQDWKFHPRHCANLKSGIRFSTYVMLPIVCKKKHNKSKFLHDTVLIFGPMYSQYFLQC